MQHDISLAGHAFGLRPVHSSDAGFVAALRADPTLNRYIHAGDGRVEDQLRWMYAYFERTGDYYFVVTSQRTGEPEGLISIYDIDGATNAGEWGRWILRPGSLAAVESVWLLYKVCFETLDLAAVYCRTVADNTKVVSFHDSCGITRRRELPLHFHLQDQYLDAIEHRVEQLDWPALSGRLERIALLTSRKVNRA